MNWTYQVTTAPSETAVSLSDLKAFMGIISSSYDSLLTAQLSAATSQIEAYLRRALVTQTITYQADTFPGINIPWWDGVVQGSPKMFDVKSFIELPRPNLQSVTSFEYYDDDNALHTFSSSNYFIDTLSVPGRIILNYGQSWPVNVRSLAALKIVYVAGYGGASSVPEAIKQALKMQAAYLFSAEAEPITSESIGQISFSYADMSSSGNSGQGLSGNVKTILNPYRVIYA
jgi:hypothetical protein